MSVELDITPPLAGLAGTIFRAMSDPALLVDCNNLQIAAVNQPAERLLGKSAAQICGNPVSRVLSLAATNGTPQNAWLSSADGITRQGSIDSANAKPTPVDIRLHRATDEAGDWLITLLRRDDAGRKVTGRSSDFHAQLEKAQSGRQGTWSWDAQSGQIRVDTSLRRLFASRLSGTTNVEEYLKFIHADDRDGCRRLWQAALEDNRPTEGIYRMLQPGGGVAHIHMASRCKQADAAGRPLQVEGSVRDITDESLVFDEEQTGYEQSAVKLREVIGAVEGFAWEYDLNTNRFSYVSTSVEQLLGFPKQRWLHEEKFLNRIVHPEDRELWVAFGDAHAVGDHDHAMDYRVIDAFGNVRHVRDMRYQKRDASGRVTHLHGLILDMTERLQVNEQLRITEERYERLFNDTPVSVWVLDCSAIRQRLDELIQEGHADLHDWLGRSPAELANIANKIQVVNVNRATLELFGRKSAADFCSRIFELFREDSLPAFVAWVLSLVDGKLNYEFENILYSANGDRLITQIRTTVASGSEQSWECVYATVVDITKRKQAEMLRDGQRSVLEKLATGGSLGGIMKTLTKEIENQSPYLHAAVFSGLGETARLWLVSSGSVPEELIHFLEGRRLSDIPLPIDAAAFTTHVVNVDMDDSAQSSARVRNSLCLLAAGLGYRLGAAFRVTGTGSATVGLLLVLRNGNGDFAEHEKEVIQNFVRLAGVVLEHELDRRSLKLKTAELESVFTAYPDAMLRVSPQGALLERYSGHHMSDVLQMKFRNANTLWDLGLADTAEKFAGAIGQISKGAEQATVEFSLIEDDRGRSYEVRFLPMPQSRDLIAVIRDISNLRQAEANVRQVSDQFRRLFEQSPTSIFVESLEGIVLDANAAACDLHQTTRETLVGKHVMELVPDYMRDCVTQRGQEIFAGRLKKFEAESLRQDGSIVPINVKVSSIDYGGQPAVLLHVRDITDERRQEELRREQERQLAHVSRLTMMGQLVAGIAHEIRQPLWSACTFADVLIEMLKQPELDRERIRELIQKLIPAVRRASEITTRMLGFARKGQPSREEVRLEGLLKSGVDFTSAHAKSLGITVALDVPEDLPVVLCDRVLIEQTVVNLLNNAYHALSTKRFGNREVHITASFDGTFVFVRVADNGPGLPSGVTVEKLFESFFTTDRSGMGIGLALSRSFITEHGGSIWAHPNESGGMTFQFSLRVDGNTQSNAVSDSSHH